jgi:ferredoxin-NADP reductase
VSHLDWQVATIEKIIPQTSEVKSFVLKLPQIIVHVPGQHYEIRLTDPTGYQAVRKYSVGSAPSLRDRIEITVQMLPNGEVSGYLDSQAEVGTQIEVRGPLGGYFIWHGDEGRPVALIGGGSGVVPLMSILRHHRELRASTPVTLLQSSRALDKVIYRQELLDQAPHRLNEKIVHTITDTPPIDWPGYRRRIDQAMLSEVLGPVDQELMVYICGPTPMVEAIATLMTGLGYLPEQIRTERFGPTG